MPQKPDSESKSAHADKPYLHGGFWYILGGVVVLCALIFCFSFYFTDTPSRLTFIAQSALNVLVLSGILVQALIYRRQWDAMQGQLREVKRQNDAFVNHERAYVGVDSGCIYGFAPKDTQSVQLIFINGGRTPAWKLWVEAKLSKEKLGGGDWTMIEPIGQPFVLMPGKTREVDWPKLTLPITAKERAAVIDEGLPIYLQGRFGFFDITGELQTDNFILQIDPRDMSFTDAGHLAKSPFPDVPLDLGIKRHSKQDKK